MSAGEIDVIAFHAHCEREVGVAMDLWTRLVGYISGYTHPLHAVSAMDGMILAAARYSVFSELCVKKYRSETTGAKAIQLRVARELERAPQDAPFSVITQLTAMRAQVWREIADDIASGRFEVKK